jgi:hypothetical protein
MHILESDLLGVVGGGSWGDWWRRYYGYFWELWNVYGGGEVNPL